MPEMMTFAKTGLGMIFGNVTTPFMTLRAKDGLHEGVVVTCDVQEFAGKAICAALANDDRIKKVDGNEHELSYSLLFQINNTKQGNYKVLRGIENVHDVGKIVEFNGNRELDQFTDDYCNIVNGTDELVFGPFMEENDVEQVFEFQACLSFDIRFRKLTKIKGRKAVRKTIQSLDTNVSLRVGQLLK